jgi:hypothetical protein
MVWYARCLHPKHSTWWQDGWLVDAPASKGAHAKTEPLALMDYSKYKIGVDKYQFLAYYSFQR